MPEKDDVSKIHDKYTLSLINPSSHYISLAISIVIAGLIGAFVAATYLESYRFTTSNNSSDRSISWNTIFRYFIFKT